MQPKNCKKDLESLTVAVVNALSHLDAIMKLPSTVERGKRIAEWSNQLEMANDYAMRFGLGYSWKKIANIKTNSERPKA